MFMNTLRSQSSTTIEGKKCFVANWAPAPASENQHNSL